MFMDEADVIKNAMKLTNCFYIRLKYISIINLFRDYVLSSETHIHATLSATPSKLEMCP